MSTFVLWYIFSGDCVSLPAQRVRVCVCACVYVCWSSLWCSLSATLWLFLIYLMAFRSTSKTHNLNVFPTSFRLFARRTLFVSSATAMSVRGGESERGEQRKRRERDIDNRQWLGRNGNSCQYVCNCRNGRIGQKCGAWGDGGFRDCGSEQVKCRTICDTNHNGLLIY